MPFSIQEMLFQLVLIPEALALAIGIIRYRRLEPPLQYLLILVGFGFITDVAMRILGHQKINNHFLIISYIPIEFWLLSRIYGIELKHLRIKRALPWLAAGLVAYSLWMGTRKMSVGLYPTGRFIEGLLIVVLALAYFHQTLKYLTTKHLGSTPMFWLSAGLFLYFSCDVLIFIFSNFILYDYSSQFNFQLWGIHAVLTIMLYLFYTLALWIDLKK